MTANKEKVKTDNRNRFMGNSEKRVTRKVIMDFKILMITTLKELSKQKKLGRKTRNVKNQMEILKLRETTVIKTEYLSTLPPASPPSLPSPN